jgi:hypothetical protein
MLLLLLLNLYMRGHGSGNDRLSADFVIFVRSEKPILACASIFDSISDHSMIYLQYKSRGMGGMPQEVVL